MAIEDGSLSKQEEMELRRKKRLKYLLYIVVFIIFQVGVITLFSLTIMKFRTPKITILSAEIPDFTTTTTATTTTTTNPSFNMTLDTVLSVKNTNFGEFKYQDSVIIFSYNGLQVGEGFVSRSKVGWRATKKVDVAAALMYDGFQANPDLGNDLNSGVLMFRSQAQLNGKVRLLWFLFKKKKVIHLDCMLTIGVLDKAVRYITCL